MTGLCGVCDHVHLVLYRQGLQLAGVDLSIEDIDRLMRVRRHQAPAGRQ